MPSHPLILAHKMWCAPRLVYICIPPLAGDSHALDKAVHQFRGNLQLHLSSKMLKATDALMEVSGLLRLVAPLHALHASSSARKLLFRSQCCTAARIVLSKEAVLQSSMLHSSPRGLQ